MNIIKKSREDLTAIDLYKMTKNADIMRMSDLPGGTPIHVEDWVLYEDQKQSTGELQIILAIRTGGEVYATNSVTFTREFADIVAMFEGEDLPDIVKVDGKSKAGRAFITCALA